MFFSVMLAAFGITSLIAAMYIYSQSDETANAKMLKIVEAQDQRLKELDKLVTSNVESVGSNNMRVKALDEKVDKVFGICQGNEKLISGLEEYCSKLKGTQIELQDQLSKKSPVIKVEIVDEKKKGKGVRSLIKESTQ